MFRQQAVDLMKNAEFEFSGHYPRKSLGYGGEMQFTNFDIWRITRRTAFFARSLNQPGGLSKARQKQVLY